MFYLRGFFGTLKLAVGVRVPLVLLRKNDAVSATVEYKA
jgi:hypothetical protein